MSKATSDYPTDEGINAMQTAPGTSEPRIRTRFRRVPFHDVTLIIGDRLGEQVEVGAIVSHGDFRTRFVVNPDCPAAMVSALRRRYPRWHLLTQRTG